MIPKHTGKFRWLIPSAVALATASLCLSSFLAPIQAATLNQLKSQDQQIQTQLTQEKTTYNSTASAALAAEEKLANIDASLYTAQDKLSRIRTDIGGVESRLFTTLTRLVITQNDLQKKQVLIAEDLRLIYEHGTVSYLDVILGANSFSDFLTRLGDLKVIVTTQVTLLRQVQAEKEQLASQAQQLQNQKTQLVDLEQQAQTQEVSYQAEAATRQQILGQLNQQKSVEMALIQHLETSDTQLMAAIHQLEMNMSNLTPSQFQALIDQMGQEYGVDPALIAAIIQQESGGNPNAVSRAGAEGLMQLMPGTAAGLGVTNPLDPTQNLQGGVQYFADQLQRFHGNICLALAAYNAGPGAVQAYGGTVPPYAETQNYVRSIVAMYLRSEPSARPTIAQDCPAYLP